MFALLDRQTFEIVLFLCFAVLVGWLRRRANAPEQQPRRAVRKRHVSAHRGCLQWLPWQKRGQRAARSITQGRLSPPCGGWKQPRSFGAWRTRSRRFSITCPP